MQASKLRAQAVKAFQRRENYETSLVRSIISSLYALSTNPRDWTGSSRFLS